MRPWMQARGAGRHYATSWLACALGRLWSGGTYNWKVSLNFAVQLLFLDFVVNLRFLSAKKGPTMETSTNGRNIPDVCHFMSFTAITDRTDLETSLAFGNPTNRPQHIYPSIHI